MKYKYVLDENVEIQTSVINYPVEHLLFNLSQGGKLTIKPGYAWDGATGVPDIPQIMRAALVHDCLYQMIRTGLIPDVFRESADAMFRDISIEDGLPLPVANLAYTVLRLVGWYFVQDKTQNN